MERFGLKGTFGYDYYGYVPRTLLTYSIIYLSHIVLVDRTRIVLGLFTIKDKGNNKYYTNTHRGRKGTGECVGRVRSVGPEDCRGSCPTSKEVGPDMSRSALLNGEFCTSEESGEDESSEGI